MYLDVLVTDGNFKHTYAILKALKAKGLKVGVVFNNAVGPSFYSRFVDKRFIIKANINNDHDEITQKAFVNELKDILEKNTISVILPVGNNSIKVFSKYKNELIVYSKFLIPDDISLEIAQNKSKTFEFADSIGVGIPKTYFIDDVNSLRPNKIDFPCVIKYVGYYQTGVYYCKNINEFQKKIVENKGNPNPIIQEVIKGNGAGFYALYQNGKCLLYFMHERLHEFPITGGSSAMAMSVFDPDLMKIGQEMLDKLNWNGVAMVEFKKTPDNKYILIEINPKWWGSLELSYKAGINFPYNYFLCCMDEKVQQIEYKKNIGFRWWLPYDLLYFFLTGKYKNKNIKLEKIYNDIYFNDPLVLLYNMIFSFYKIITVKKFPHGRLD